METYRIHDDASVCFVTYSVVSWLPVFLIERACRIVTDSLAFCHAHKGLRVNAYAIMPTHMHAIVLDHLHRPAHLTAALNAFRRYTGRALAEHCVRNQPCVFTEAFRKAVGADRQRRFWQFTRHPIAICSARFWQQKLEFIHGNPVRKGLVRYPEDWRFSSARYYATGNEEDEDVAITQITW